MSGRHSDRGGGHNARVALCPVTVNTVDQMTLDSANSMLQFVDCSSEIRSIYHHLPLFTFTINLPSPTQRMVLMLQTLLTFILLLNNLPVQQPICQVVSTC